MKLTKENKLKIVQLTFDIKKKCEEIESIILKNQGTYCFDSGEFREIDHLFDLAKDLRDIGCKQYV